MENVKSLILHEIRCAQLFESKEKGKDQESAPHLTQDTAWRSDKNTRKHHIQVIQEVSPFHTGVTRLQKTDGS